MNSGMKKKIVFVTHPQGTLVECDMPKCPNKTTHPSFKFCETCQLFVDKVDYAADFLGYFHA